MSDGKALDRLLALLRYNGVTDSHPGAMKSGWFSVQQAGAFTRRRVLNLKGGGPLSGMG